MTKTKNRWSIPPAKTAQKPEANIEPLAVRAKDAARMLSVSVPKFATLVAPSGAIIPIQPGGKGATKLFLVSDLLSYLTGERDKARAAFTASTSADASP